MRYSQQVDFTDIIAEPLPDFYFNNGTHERQEKGTLRVLSLFSGCGGMDIGLEGGFICHQKSAGKGEWIEQRVNDNWVLLRRNVFRTVFACLYWYQAFGTHVPCCTSFTEKSCS